MEQRLTAVMANTDLDLREEIETRLWSLDVIRVAHPALDIDVQNGHGVVRGVVESRMMHAYIAEALADLPVMLEVVSDSQLESAAAMALATDGRTHSLKPGFQVMSRSGMMTVAGKFSAEERAAVAAVVSSVKGVRGVVVS